MDNERGLYGKFEVRRVDGKDQPGGPKEGAKYFVLDYVHDPYARPALAAYALACKDTHPQLSLDLRSVLGELDYQFFFVKGPDEWFATKSITALTGFLNDEGFKDWVIDNDAEARPEQVPWLRDMWLQGVAVGVIADVWQVSSGYSD